METMARIARKKPIVVLKVGRSEIGAKAANSHTGSLAGADAVYDGAFRQFGIIRVDTIEELLDTLQAFDQCVIPKGSRIFILSQAGGPGIYCTDGFVAQKNLAFPLVSQETKDRMTVCLPDMANVCSPEGYADITAAANVKHHVESLKIVLEDDAVDGVIFITVVPTFLPQKELAEELVKLLKEKGYGTNKPVYICIMAGNYVWQAREILEKNGIRTFDTPVDCVTVASHMVAYQQFLQSRGGEEK